MVRRGPVGRAGLLTALAAAVFVVACAELPPLPPAPPPVPFSAEPVPAGSWQVGERRLPLREDGYGQVLPTPPELVDRRLPTRDLLAPPASGGYEWTVTALSPELLARTTWKPGCPVPPEQLRYLTMSFWGFDELVHTGEMIVHADVAEAVVGVFGQLFEARFPIEEMRVVGPADMAAFPTGDGNNTSAYACRTATGQTRFSAHSYGLAIDVNPFQNPLVRSDGLVIPELASAYTDRTWERLGMIGDGGVVVTGFEGIGWTWGARWRAPVDTMHFSATGD